jgi:predicted dienelactone hydrolase
MNKKWIAVVICAAVLVGIIVVPTSAANPDFDPPDEIGPYLVGYTNLQLMDVSRNQEIGGRPIVVDLYYPADPDNNGQPLLPAEYVMDPFGVLRMDKIGYATTSSTLWEGHGLDPVYQAPTPSQDGPFPLVVFSPGYGFPGYGYIYIGARLASHGFVVAILTDYDDFHTERSAMEALNRPLDVSFALTDLLARNLDSAYLLYGMINENQIAAAGHSFGGYSAQALAGGVDSVCEIFYEEWLVDPIEGPPLPETCVPIYPDERIKAIVTLDGANFYLYFAELARITLPAMGIGQEWDLCATDPTWSSVLQATTWQARQHLAMKAHPNYRVDVTGAVHKSFANWCEAMDIGYEIGYFSKKEYKLYKCPERPISQAEVERLTSMYMIAFLKVNLVGEPGYQQFLTPGYALVNEPNIEFFETERGDPDTVNVEWPDYSYYFMHQPGK